MRSLEDKQVLMILRRWLFGKCPIDLGVPVDFVFVWDQIETWMIFGG
jgi:hypothetical protein